MGHCLQLQGESDPRSLRHGFACRHVVSWHLTEAGHEVLEGVLPVGLIRQVVVLRQGPPACEGRALVSCAERGCDTLRLLRGPACGRRNGVTYIPPNVGRSDIPLSTNLLTMVGWSERSRQTNQVCTSGG